MRYIKGYDGLRAISILFVMLNHLGVDEFIPDNTFLSNRVYQLVSGNAGVNIFFTLSGFLITLILIHEYEKNGRIQFKKFFIRRFLRLLPPLLVFYLMVAVLMIGGYLAPNYIALMVSVVYLYNFVPELFYIPELGHTWSLGLEEQFYLTWPFIIQRFYAKKKIPVIAISVIVISIVAMYVLRNLYIPIEHNGKTFSLLQDGFKTHRWFFPAVAPIIIGALGGYLVIVAKVRLQKLLTQSLSKVFGLIALLYLSLLYLPNFLLPIGFIFQAIGVALLLLWIYFQQDALLCKIMEWSPLRYIGKISYGLYVYQGLFLTTGPTGVLKIQHFPLNICLVILMAVISYHTIEKKALSLKDRYR